MNEGAAEIPQSTEAVFTKEAAEEGIKISVDEAGKRAEQAGKPMPAIDLQAQADLAELTNDAAPGLSKEDRESIIKSKAEVDELIATKTGSNGVELTDGDIDVLASKFSSMGFRNDSEGVDSFIKSNNIPDKYISAIKAKMRGTDDSDRQKSEMSVAEATMKGKVADQMKATVESTQERVQKDLDKGIEDATKGGDYKKAAELTKQKISVSSMLNRFRGMFADGERGKEWSIRVGKVLYYAFIVSFLFLIWEMNAIGKLGRSSR